MKHSLILIVAIFLNLKPHTTLADSEGGVQTRGGHVVICKDPITGEPTSITTSELWEWDGLLVDGNTGKYKEPIQDRQMFWDAYWKNAPQTSTSLWKQQIEWILKHSFMDPAEQKILTQKLETYAARVQWVDGKLPPSNDDTRMNNRTPPQNCSIQQAAVFLDTNKDDDEKFEFYLDRSIFYSAHFTPTQQAALVFHELLYSLIAEQRGDTLSALVRIRIYNIFYNSMWALRFYCDNTIPTDIIQSNCPKN
jgi:hypothetical protein